MQGDIPDWLKNLTLFAGVAGGPVYCVWYSYYMTAKRLPQIEDAHASEIKELHRVHAAHIDLLTNNYRMDLQEINKERREDGRMLSDALNKLAESVKEKGCRFHAS